MKALMRSVLLACAAALPLAILLTLQWHHGVRTQASVFAPVVVQTGGADGAVGACCSPETDVTCHLFTLDECLAFGGDWLGANTQCQGHVPCCLPDGGCLFVDRVCCLNIDGNPLGPDDDCSTTDCAALGACCFDFDDGPLAYDTCVLDTEAGCVRSGGVFQGAGSMCVSAACCLPGGYCQPTQPGCCEASGGTPLPVGTGCFGSGGCNFGACCFDIDDGPVPYDTCVVITEEECEADGGVFQGADSTCTQQACCLGGNLCVNLDPECCEASGGIVRDGPCDTIDGCPAIGACCFDFDDGPLAYDTCVVTDAASCDADGGFFQGAGSTCTLQACCLPSGFCQDTDPQCCIASGGTPQQAPCSTVICPVQGACCFDADGDGINESCSVVSTQMCTQLNGLFQGVGTVCQGQGACCFGITGGACVVVDGICCDDILGSFQGVGTVCLGDINGNGINDACECIGDVNGDGVVDVNDLIIVIINWGPCPTPVPCPGDVDGNGIVDVNDLILVILNWGPC